MAYAPDRGDAVWVTLDPQAGHEQAGRRPAVVLSPVAYNRKVGLVVLCPITNQIKGYPFEVIIPHGLKVTGAILSDQVKNLDWKARDTKLICRLPASVTDEALKKLNTLLRSS
ncbi:MAG TPA: endoribonuclease MazF [Pyrinomonadaceae bacterium]|jgi:mRNA interferase MazF|nr:endoribonuclease MazF [Pyrinomonadaceae bacterium]